MAIERKIDQLMTALKASGSTNLPRVASELGFDWFGEIKPAIDSTPKFQKLVQELFEVARWDVLSKVAETAIEGRPRNGRAPDLAAAKAFMAWIDKGYIMGKMKEEEQEKPMSKEELAQHLKRLGLQGANEEEPTND